jgi:hypothetical protein
MRSLSAISVTALVALVAYTPVSQAFNFGNMMNPSRWMGGGDRDRYDDYDEFYPGGPYGAPGFGYPYGGYGPGYGAPGYGAYGAPGYGVPGYGAAVPGYGAPAYPSAPVAAPGVSPAPTTAPASGGAGDSAEVQALKRRVEELEAAQKQEGSAPPPPPGDWPAAPAFRPMNQY